MSEFTSMPGPQAVLTAQQRRLFRGYPSQLQLLGIAIASAAVDAANTPTTDLRTGLIMGQVAASGLFKQYDPTATDGTQFPVGILYEDRAMLNPDTATAQQQTATLVIGGGPVVASNCIGLDPRARQFLGQFIMFDDRIPGEAPGWAGPVAKTADYTCVEADSGKMFTNQGAAGAVVFTLPTTIKAGWRARFYCEAGQTITVTAPANKLVAFNNATATSLAFSTANEKIGGMIEIMANADQTKYLAIVHLGIETQTPVVS